MILLTNSSVFNTDAKAIVNTINCVGVMGKGLALEFALRYPELEKTYKLACSEHKVKIGKMFLYKVGDLTIINFPTKFHFRFPSKIEYIEEGLLDLKRVIKEENIKKIAIPPLGCGLGRLDFAIVKDLIEKNFQDLDDVIIFLCLDKNPAEGKEKMLIENFNKASLLELNFKKDVLDALFSHKNKLIRFSDLLKDKKITKSIYIKLYKYLENY